MKVAITIVSGLCVGLLMAFNGLTPLLEAKAVFEQRRRLMFSAFLGMAAFTFVMAAVILGTIDLALQYEVQGFILWEMVLSVAVGFLVAGAVCGIAAKLVFPKAKPSALALLGEQAGFGNVMEEIQGFVQGYIQQAAVAAQNAAAQAAAASNAPPASQTSSRSASAVAEEAPPVVRPEERERHARGDMNIDSQVGLVH